MENMYLNQKWKLVNCDCLKCLPDWCKLACTFSLTAGPVKIIEICTQAARVLVAKVAKGKSTVVVLHNASLGDFCLVFKVKNRTEIHKNRLCIASITWPCAWIRARHKVLQLKANYHLPACLLYRIWFLTFKQKKEFSFWALFSRKCPQWGILLWFSVEMIL